MRARDLFGVAIRVLGVYYLSAAAYWALWAVWRAHGGPSNPVYEGYGEYVGDALICFIRGTGLLLFATPLIWLCYGVPPAPSDEDADTE